MPFNRQEAPAPMAPEESLPLDRILIQKRPVLRVGSILQLDKIGAGARKQREP